MATIPNLWSKLANRTPNCTIFLLIQIIYGDIDSDPQYLYITDNNEPLIWDGEVYMPWGIKYSMPSQATDSDGMGRISFSAVDQTIIRLAREQKTYDKDIRVRISAKLYDFGVGDKYTDSAANEASVTDQVDFFVFPNMDYPIEAYTESMTFDSGAHIDLDGDTGVVSFTSEDGETTEIKAGMTIIVNSTIASLDVVSPFWEDCVIRNQNLNRISEVHGGTFNVQSVNLDRQWAVCELATGLLIGENYPRIEGTNVTCPGLL